MAGYEELAREFAVPPVAERIQRRSLIVGAVAAVLAVVGLILDPTQFFRSFLMSYVFWIGISLGCLAIVMLQHLSGGLWGYVVRRPLEAGARTLFPFMALLFLVFLFGMDNLYKWARPEEVAKDPLLQYKAQYWLNEGLWWLRAALYLTAWSSLAVALTRWSRRHDREPSPALRARMARISGPGIVVYALMVTFMSVDWVMSLDPHWFSTIFGFMFIAGQGLSALAFVVAIGVLLVRNTRLEQILEGEQLHDLGKLMLAFVMIWAYMAYSQLLIVWMGNLSEEIPWYVTRFRGGWAWVGVALVLFHFALPFLLLLSRDLKRDARRLSWVASGILLMRLVDIFWLVQPNFAEHGFHLHWLDIVTPAAVGGFWMWFFFRELRSAPMLPLHDPCFEQVMSEEHARA